MIQTKRPLKHCSTAEEKEIHTVEALADNWSLQVKFDGVELEILLLPLVQVLDAEGSKQTAVEDSNPEVEKNLDGDGGEPLLETDGEEKDDEDQIAEKVDFLNDLDMKLEHEENVVLKLSQNYEREFGRFLDE